MEEKTKHNLPYKQASVRKYTASVLKESSVTALADIVSTSNIPRKLFKIIVLLFCATGFVYQCTKFLSYVFEYPTIVDIKIQQTDFVELPAYTFCNINAFSRKRFCATYEDRCIAVNDNTTRVPKKEFAMMLNEMTVEDFIELGQDRYTFIKVGSYRMDIQGPIIRMKEDSYDGERLGCYSIRTVFQGPDEARVEKQENNIYKSAIDRFEFDVEEEDMFIVGRKAGMMFSIHSPLEGVNPVGKGIFMRPGRRYKIHVNIEEELLLPYPYETDCMNYTDNWLKNNRTGPRTENMCEYKCVHDIFLDLWNVTHPFILYPSNASFGFPGPMRGEHSARMDVYFQCMRDCKEDCVKRKYTIEEEERFIERNVQEYNENSTTNKSDNHSQKIVVEIYLDAQEIKTFSHRPQYAIVEYFSYIGGFIGVWLGISLVQVADFFESVFRILRYAFQKNQKKRHLKNMRGNESVE